MTQYTRRDAKRLSPEILGQYHALVMKGDVPSFEKLLDQYAPELPTETHKELVGEFTRLSVIALRKNWRPSK
jgi:hypothetical protein